MKTFGLLDSIPVVREVYSTFKDGVYRIDLHRMPEGNYQLITVGGKLSPAALALFVAETGGRVSVEQLNGLECDLGQNKREFWSYVVAK